MKKVIFTAIIATSSTLSFGPKPRPSIIPTSPCSPTSTSPKKVSPKRKIQEALKDTLVEEAKKSYADLTATLLAQTKEDTKKLEDFMAFIKEEDLSTTVITFASKALVKQRKHKKHNTNADLPFEEQDFFNQDATENYIVAKELLLRELEDENPLFSDKQLKTLSSYLLKHLFDALGNRTITPLQFSQEILEFKLITQKPEELQPKKLQF